MTTSTSYIWKYSPYDTTSHNAGRENGFIPGTFGTQKFKYEGFQTSSIT